MDQTNFLYLEELRSLMLSFLPTTSVLSFRLTNKEYYLVHKIKALTKDKCESRFFPDYPRGQKDIIKYNLAAPDNSTPSESNYQVTDSEEIIWYLRYRTYEQIMANKWLIAEHKRDLLCVNQDINEILKGHSLYDWQGYFIKIAGNKKERPLQYKLCPQIFELATLVKEIKSLNDVLAQKFSIIKECFNCGYVLTHKRILCTRPKVIKWLWEIGQISDGQLIGRALANDCPDLVVWAYNKITTKLSSNSFDGVEPMKRTFERQMSFKHYLVFEDIKSNVFLSCPFIREIYPNKSLSLAIKLLCKQIPKKTNQRVQLGFISPNGDMATIGKFEVIVTELCQVYSPNNEDYALVLKCGSANLIRTLFSKRSLHFIRGSISTQNAKGVNLVLLEFCKPDDIVYTRRDWSLENRFPGDLSPENESLDGKSSINMNVDYTKEELCLVLTSTSFAHVLKQKNEAKMAYLYHNFGNRFTQHESLSILERGFETYYIAVGTLIRLVNLGKMPTDWIIRTPSWDGY